MYKSSNFNMIFYLCRVSLKIADNLHICDIKLRIYTHIWVAMRSFISLFKSNIVFFISSLFII